MGKAKIQPMYDNVGFQDWELSSDQKTLGNVMRENDIVFVTGRAGSGKTAGVLYHFMQNYMNDKSRNIVVIRTPVEAGMDKIGALPSGLNEKIEPHFMPAKKILTELLNPQKVQCDLEKRIHFKIPNFCLGDTFDNTDIIIDEAQQLPPLIMKLLLERIGKNSRCIVCGDKSQLYASDGKRNGLTHAIEVFSKEKYSKIGFFDFSSEVNQRSEIVKTVNTAYEKFGM